MNGNTGYNMYPLLLCNLGHWSGIPKIGYSDGVNIGGKIECSQCLLDGKKEYMFLISYGIMNREPDWEFITNEAEYRATGRWYK